MKLLAIETSCDDTCAAVTDGPRVLSNVVSSQAALHEEFGGVVPEVASRHHLELVNAVVAAALTGAETKIEEVDAIAVTRGPGLIGALLVGLSTAKALAAAHRKPLIPVDHLQGHVAANFLEPEPLEPPFLCLVASGGHTLLAGARDHSSFETLGATLDDAAGEAFDKGARLLGLGYPGGPAIERAAREGDPEAFEFPVAMSERGLDFSYSGIKTALVYLVRDLGPERTERRRADLAASYQRGDRRSAGREARAGGAVRGLAGGRARRGSGRQHRAQRACRLPLRRAGASPEAGPDRALHGQRGDDRLGGPLSGADSLPRLPGLRCVRHRP